MCLKFRVFICPSFFETAPRGSLLTSANAQVAKESPRGKNDRSKQSKAIWLGVVGMEQAQGSRLGVKNACHMDRILLLYCGKGKSLHVNKKL